MDSNSKAPSFIAAVLSMNGLRIVSDTDACIQWIGSLDQRGYGRAYVAGKQHKAHRVMWMLANGRPIPRGMVIRHACDRPDCVNPRHLLLGTHADNVQDCNERGRRNQVRGSKHGESILTEENVRSIRQRYKPRTVTLRQLGSEFGVHEATIHNIVSGKTWRHV